MITPIEQNLTVYIGGTWQQEFIFWDDKAATVPHSFAGLTASFTYKYIDGKGEHNGSGTASISGNAITCSLTSVQTAALPYNNAKYVLSVSDGGSPADVDYLAHGLLVVTDLG